MLAAVFLSAGLAKLARFSPSRETAVALGVPERLGGLAVLAVCAAELAIAGLLLAASTAAVGAVAALALLLVFSLLVARALARGETPDCNCFGALSQGPVGRGTIARNAGLAVLAAVPLVIGTGDSAVAWIGELEGAELGFALGMFGAVAVAVGLLVVCIALLRRHGRLLTQVDVLRAELGGEPSAPSGPTPSIEVGKPPPSFEVGTPAPPLRAHDLDGEPVGLDDLMHDGRPLVLFFIDPACGACESLLPRVANWQRELSDELTVAVISRGSVSGTRDFSDEHGLRHVLVQAGDVISLDYRVHGMPGAILVGADRQIASDVALGEKPVEELVDSVVASGAGRS